MKFEEEFPSLEFMVKKGKWAGGMIEFRATHDLWSEHLLDKQRLRELIDKGIESANKWHDKHPEGLIHRAGAVTLEHLKRELGL